MKKIIFIILVLISVKTYSQTTKAEYTGTQIYYSGNYLEIFEFLYKGHVYIATHVRDGLSTTHAGHC